MNPGDINPNPIPPPTALVSYAILENYIRNMDNQVFLSEHQINNFYYLLLLNHASPWEGIVHSGAGMRAQIEHLIDERVQSVEVLLTEIFQSGQERQIESSLQTTQKLTDILNAKHKSIHISRIHPSSRFYEPQNKDIYREVMEVFTGISSIASMVGNNSWKYVEYCPIERFVTYKIGTRYLMKARTHDPILFDERSVLSRLPRQMFINGIFRFLNAEEVFLLRGVCHQWRRHVKDGWMFCFKREMRSQIILSEFCKDIEEYYKLIQLRNLIYQKLTLLMHALSELIDWQLISTLVESGEISPALKKVIMVLLKLIGENDDVAIQHVGDLSEVNWNSLRPKALQIGAHMKTFLSDFHKCVLSIRQLKNLRLNILSNPFMRMEEIGTEDKTPLLACLMTKLLTLQSILKNHIMLTQEYLIAARKRLDGVYKGLSRNRGFLEEANRLILQIGQHRGPDLDEPEQASKQFSMINFMRSLNGTAPEGIPTPDYCLSTRNSRLEIFIDNACKMDILMCTLRRTMPQEQSEEAK